MIVLGFSWGTSPWSVGQVANLPEQRQVGNLPHGRSRPPALPRQKVLTSLVVLLAALAASPLLRQSVRSCSRTPANPPRLRGGWSAS